MKQPPYTKAQVLANLKLIAGIAGMDIPHPDTHRGRMKSELVDIQNNLADIQAICVSVIQRGIK